MPPTLVDVLQRAGFKGDALRTAYGLSMRESGGRADAFNPNVKTGDQSYGLFQINMLGDLGPARRAQYGLQSNEQLLDPATNARVAYQMSKGGTDFGAWGLGPNAYRRDPNLNAAFLKYYNQFPGAGGGPVVNGGAGPVPGSSLPQAATKGPYPTAVAKAKPDPLSGLMSSVFAEGDRMFGLPQSNLIQNLFKQPAQPQQRQLAVHVAPVPSSDGGNPSLAAWRRTASYPLASRPGKLIGTPYQGTHTMYGNWESDNALDISTPVGTPVRAPVGGVIGQQIGALNSSDPRLGGLRVHVVGGGNEFYLQHLSRLVVRAGQRVAPGQIIGYSGEANGTPHLHIASKYGNPEAIFGYSSSSAQLA